MLSATGRTLRSLRESTQGRSRCVKAGQNVWQGPQKAQVFSLSEVNDGANIEDGAGERPPGGRDGFIARGRDGTATIGERHCTKAKEEESQAVMASLKEVYKLSANRAHSRIVGG